MFDFNMATFTNEEQATANLDPDTFAPTGLNIDQWLDAAVSSGAQYAVLTTKHSDGFALWPTAYHVPGYAAYGIAATTWYANNGSPDIVSQFVTKCRSRSLNPVLYYCTQDRTWEARTGKTSTTDYQSFMSMIEQQLTELLSNYGSIFALWLDAWSGSYLGMNGFSGGPAKRVYNLIQSLQPNCLMIGNYLFTPRPNPYSQLEEYEQPAVIGVGNTTPSEEVWSIRNDGLWFYNSTKDQTSTALRTAADLNAATAQANGRNGTRLLGVTPSTAGVLPDAQVTLMGNLHT